MIGSPDDGRKLDRSRILRLFERLNRKLADKDARATVYIVGGAAMAIAFDRDRMTEDVDAAIERGRATLQDAIRELAYEEDLPDDWLNEYAKPWIPDKPDERARTVFQSE